MFLRELKRYTDCPLHFHYIISGCLCYDYKHFESTCFKQLYYRLLAEKQLHLPYLMWHIKCTYKFLIEIRSFTRPQKCGESSNKVEHGIKVLRGC